MIPSSGEIQTMRHFPVLLSKKRTVVPTFRSFFGSSSSTHDHTSCTARPVENPAENDLAMTAFSPSVVLEIRVIAIPGPYEAIEGVCFLAEDRVRTVPHLGR